MSNLILALESSCDETAVALLKDGIIIKEYVASQLEHEAFGGVVPELASRAHQRSIVPTLDRVMNRLETPLSSITHIAYTQGPGLLGALLVGVSFAKALAFSLGIPALPIHHLKAHIFANFLNNPKPSLPFLSLVVSGGHTQLIWVEDYYKMTILGETRDDAAGEAFDKIAKIMGFPYPGGIHIDKNSKNGNPKAFKFPITNMENFDFSFSGIKTSFLYFVEKQKKQNPNFIKENLEDICASVQYAIVKMLTKKVIKAVKYKNAKSVVLGGGVVSNSFLKSELNKESKEGGWKLFYPSNNHCMDNAAMVGSAANYILKNNLPIITDLGVEPKARIPL